MLKVRNTGIIGPHPDYILYHLRNLKIKFRTFYLGIFLLTIMYYSCHKSSISTKLPL